VFFPITKPTYFKMCDPRRRKLQTRTLKWRAAVSRTSIFWGRERMRLRPMVYKIRGEKKVV